MWVPATIESERLATHIDYGHGLRLSIVCKCITIISICN